MISKYFRLFTNGWLTKLSEMAFRLQRKRWRLKCKLLFVMPLKTDCFMWELN